MASLLFKAGKSLMNKGKNDDAGDPNAVDPKTGLTAAEVKRNKEMYYGFGPEGNPAYREEIARERAQRAQQHGSASSSAPHSAADSNPSLHSSNSNNYSRPMNQPPPQNSGYGGQSSPVRPQPNQQYAELSGQYPEVARVPDQNQYTQRYDNPSGPNTHYDSSARTQGGAPLPPPYSPAPDSLRPPVPVRPRANSAEEMRYGQGAPPPNGQSYGPPQPERRPVDPRYDGRGEYAGQGGRGEYAGQGRGDYAAKGARSDYARDYGNEYDSRYGRPPGAEHGYDDRYGSPYAGYDDNGQGRRYSDDYQGSSRPPRRDEHEQESGRRRRGDRRERREGGRGGLLGRGGRRRDGEREHRGPIGLVIGTVKDVAGSVRHH